MKHKIILFFVAATLFLNVDAQTTITKNGQELNVITTAVPLLMIGPDARAGGKFSPGGRIHQSALTEELGPHAVRH